MIGLRMVKKNYDNMLSRFHLIPERHGRTDRQRTNVQICYINIARQYADARQKQQNRLSKLTLIHGDRECLNSFVRAIVAGTISGTVASTAVLIGCCNAVCYNQRHREYDICSCLCLSGGLAECSWRCARQSRCSMLNRVSAEMRGRHLGI